MSEPERSPEPPSGERVAWKQWAWIVGVLLVLILLAGLCSNNRQGTQSSSSSSAVGGTTAEQASASRDQVQKLKPLNTSGSGSDAVTIKDLQQGLRTFTYTYQDNGPNKGFFAMDLLDSRGRTVGSIGSSIGTTRGAKAIRIDRTGDYVVNVQSTQGSWTLEVT